MHTRLRSISGLISVMIKKKTKINNATLRSAKVLSFITADDMDTFDDIEREFRSAVDNKGLGYLSQIET